MIVFNAINSKIIIGSIILLLCSSCTPVGFTDVSDNEDLRKYIGKTLVLPGEGLAIGVTADKNYKKQVDYILLVSPPGFTGPEVIFVKKTPPDLKVKITNVLMTNHVIFENYYFRVKSINAEDFGDVVVIKVSKEEMDSVLKEWGVD